MISYMSFEYDKKNIGKKIRHLRLKNNLSIDELAAMLELSPAFIGLLERGQRGAKLDNLVKLSRIFEVDIKELLYSTSDEIASVNEGNRQSKIDTLRTLSFDLSEKELDYLLASVRNIKKLRLKDDEDDDELSYSKSEAKFF